MISEFAADGSVSATSGQPASPSALTATLRLNTPYLARSELSLESPAGVFPNIAGVSTLNSVTIIRNGLLNITGSGHCQLIQRRTGLATHGRTVHQHPPLLRHAACCNRDNPQKRNAESGVWDSGPQRFRT